ncbi:MAG: dihydrodipicolinate synthase family protein, partial [Firmicutes bacterium]|nr:dihydrodipicolinate synthase family protein [Bacillota bacterium]
MSLFQGAATALVTPFKDGKPDYAALKNLIEFQITSGIDAIVSCGTTGEASTLSLEDQIQVVQFTIDTVNHRVPVIAGAGSNDTQVALTKAKAMEYAGADGILMVTPYYNKCSQKGLIQHYTYIADRLKRPI